MVGVVITGILGAPPRERTSHPCPREFYMTRFSRSLAVLPVVAVLAACGSSATAPSFPRTTTTYYAGLFSNAAASGTATAKIVSTTSGEVLAARERAGSGPSGSGVGPLGAGGSTITITMTLLNNTVLTLTGNRERTTFTVSDNLGDMCTGTVANLLTRTCTVSFDPGAQITLLMLLQGGPVDIAGGLDIYCGFETVPSGVTPDVSVVLGIWGLNSTTMTTVVDTSFIARVSTLDNSLSFFLDATATFNNVADTLVGSNTDYFTGTLTGTGTNATWNGTEMSSGCRRQLERGPLYAGSRQPHRRQQRCQRHIHGARQQPAHS